MVDVLLLNFNNFFAVDIIQHIISVPDDGEHLDFHENCYSEGHSLH